MLLVLSFTKMYSLKIKTVKRFKKGYFFLKKHEQQQFAHKSRPFAQNGLPVVCIGGCLLLYKCKTKYKVAYNPIYLFLEFNSLSCGYISFIRVFHTIYLRHIITDTHQKFIWISSGHYNF